MLKGWDFLVDWISIKMSNKKKILNGKTNQVGEDEYGVEIVVEEDRNEFKDVEKQNENRNSYYGIQQLDVKQLRNI